jgi:negative regulator of flagellin synthesis FlgM
MKISGNDNQVLQLTNLARASSVGNAGDSQEVTQTTTAGGDTVELSSLKETVSALKEQVRAVPDIDEEKVARIKEAIDSGTYNADGRMVARSILKANFTDEVL